MTDKRHSTTLNQIDQNMINPQLLLTMSLPPCMAGTISYKIKWDHLEISASGKTDYHCKIKQTLFIQNLKPAFNVNISSEKLMLY